MSSPFLQATDLPQPGTKVELVDSPDPPMPIGSRGTVRGFGWHPAGEHSWARLSVTWDDNNATLDLIVPPDRYRVLDDEELPELPPEQLRAPSSNEERADSCR